MRETPDPVTVELANELIRDRLAQLIRSNEALREQVRDLSSENASLTRQLAEAVAGSKLDRESRRAALNLMEDAVLAQQAERRELLERRRIERELRLADQRKNEFLATLAHELRAPLAPIRNSLNLLRLTKPTEEELEHLHDLLDRQVSHLVRLVDDLMEVSRITHGSIELRREMLDMSQVVENAVELSRPLIEARGHQLTVNLPVEPVKLDADPVRLTQVLSNLLTNAAKYTEVGGQIGLSVERDATTATVSVRDTGEGIPSDMLESVFDLFTQVDRTYNRSQGGLGIGLTLVRSLVHMHGGTIEARSTGQTGHGSEFIVRLPLCLSAACVAHSLEKQAAPQTLAGRRIVVVDDNYDAAETLALLLKTQGADVCTANDGLGALEAFCKHRPSVVILDIGMPVMDGNEVARRIRQLPDGRDVQLIALTGWGQDEDRRLCKQAGFDHHLVKPVKLNELRELISNLQELPSKEASV